MAKKTPMQIVVAIERHGEEARQASKFPSILIEEILAGGYSEPAEVEEIKNKVSQIARDRRLERRRMESVA